MANLSVSPLMKLSFIAFLVWFLAGCGTRPTGVAKGPSSSESIRPKVSATAVNEAPQWIFGFFKNPGRYAWTNGMTLKDGIDAAGCATEYGSSRVWIRHSDKSEDICRLRYEWWTTNNPTLRPGDRISNVRDL
jgi:hypothetical protein